MKKTIKALGLTVGLILTASAVSAAPCATTGSIALTTTPVDLTGTCTVGTISFSNFRIAGAIVPGGSVTPFQMDVNSTATGLLFTYNNFIGLDFTVTYQISPGVGSMILGTNSAVGITEILCSVVFDPALLQTCAGQGGTSVSGSVTAGGQVTIGPLPGGNGIFAFKDVNGGSDFTQVVIPEPVSISLVGLGLLGLGLAGRRRRK